jgi:Raf kinase inhibitor-like YbhB/YbcL family protein
MIDVIALGVALVGLLGPPPQKGATVSLSITSSAFKPNGSIPLQYTCDGKDLSPPLAWSGVPEGTRSLALVVDDPDAPDPKAPKTRWVHWVLLNIPPDATGLPEGASSKALPRGTREGRNDWKRADWGGPCPPIGRHRYFFKLYALDAVLPEIGHGGHPTRSELEAAMKGRILAQAELVGTYQREH